jgi:hypothetical protein
LDGEGSAMRALLLAVILLFPLSVFAHIGDQNVFFEGNAGPYPVRVVIRPPGVIPGLSEISVRVETNGVERVTVLPMRWDTSRKGAPSADEAKAVRGETNLFSGELWFMREGAQSVEVEITGTAGKGKVIVPVNAVATRVLGMSPALRRILVVLGILLIALAVSIAGAAVRESVLPPGATVSKSRRWFARATITVAAVGIVAFLVFGDRWWESEARDYRNNRLYRPLDAKARVETTNGLAQLILERTSDATTYDPSRRNGPLVPEHGKLMHLFLIREPGMDAFAHLHPIKRDWKKFATPLPSLPKGDYRVYADITYESGFSDTLTATVQLNGDASPKASLDADDSWRIAEGFKPQNFAKQTNALTPELSMELSASGPLEEDRDTQLRCLVRELSGEIVTLQSYMGMGGHLIVRRDDGSVFTHLHPSGSYSMTAQQLFELRDEGKAPLKVGAPKGEPICRIPAPGDGPVAHMEVTFPYAFPKAGAYRVWAQVKIGNVIHTGVFDFNVATAKRQ